MIDSESACPWGRENRAGEGRRAKFRHECLDEPEDARPATICSGIQGCGGLGSGIYYPPFFAFMAAVSFGRILLRSPTIPRSQNSKIGAFWSLLIATMFSDLCMPTLCWMAPEMPAAR